MFSYREYNTIVLMTSKISFYLDFILSKFNYIIFLISIFKLYRNEYKIQ